MQRRFLSIWLVSLLTLCNVYAQNSHWQCNIRSFQYDMTLYAELSLDGTTIVQEGYEVAAFCGEECRGVATVETIAGTDKAYYYLRVRSNVVEGEIISFKYYDIALNREVEVAETINFASQAILGYPSTPFTLTKVNYCEINVWAEDNGIVTGGGIVSEGSEVTLLAIPNEGYHFVEWSDGTKDNPYVFIARVNKDISASFAVNKYEVTYIVDGEVMKKDSIEYGATIIITDSPIKEGHTFSGWSEVPETMPAEDVTVSGTFTINKYLVTFKIGDEVVSSDSLEYGAAIVGPEAPEKEGHTFDGWGEVAETVPANDVTYEGSYTVNNYTITFKIGEEVIYTESMPYGSNITVPEAPEKEGHTFDGWGDVAKTVPASDLTYEGSYTVNSYLLTYTVDGEVVQADSVVYGTAITALAEPTKEGYTFSGWNEVPETMPAEDVTVSGTFTINKYLVTFKIGDEVVSSDSLEYGAAIVGPEAPEKEGHTFDGWGEVAETVPANDVTYEGSYTVNNYTITFKIGEEVIYTESMPYGSNITVPEAPEKEGHTFDGWGDVAKTVPASDLTYEGSYTVNIYTIFYYVDNELVHTAEVAYGEAIPEYIYEPNKEGDVFEGWIGENYETMPAHNVTYTANIESGIEDIEDTEIIQNSELIYDLLGRKVTNTKNLRNGIYIINNRKVMIK